ncbi:40S ribosomal protein S20 [Plecturocebus cupreus]
MGPEVAIRRIRVSLRSLNVEFLEKVRTDWTRTAKAGNLQVKGPAQTRAPRAFENPHKRLLVVKVLRPGLASRGEHTRDSPICTALSRRLSR